MKKLYKSFSKKEIAIFAVMLMLLVLVQNIALAFNALSDYKIAHSEAMSFCVVGDDYNFTIMKNGDVYMWEDGHSNDIKKVSSEYAQEYMDNSEYYSRCMDSSIYELIGEAIS